MAGIGINFDLSRGRREKDLRKRDILQYLPMLADKGFTPEEINSITKKYIEGGGMELPTQRTTILPNDPSVDVPTRSINEPIELKDNKRKVYYDMTNQQPVTAESVGLPSGTEIKPIYSSKKQTIKKSEKPIKSTKQSGTKRLTKEIAAQFLQQANGNKEMARKLAREAGYSF